MRTRNSNFPNNSNVTIPRRQNKGRAPNIVEPELRTIVAPMAEHTMEELLRAPTEGYGETMVLPEINADHFEIKTNLLQLVQANPFHGLENENPHAHINSFKRITSTLRFRNVPNDVIKLMMFPYSLEGAAKTCEAWERFKEMLRACPHHGFTELTQVDTFYNGLNDNDQDSLNAAAGGNLLSKTTREALNIIENKSKVRYSRNKPNASRMNTTSRESVSKTDERIDKLADQLSTLVEIVSTKVVTPAPVKAVEETCVTCGGAHSWYNCPTTDNNQASVCATTGYELVDMNLVRQLEFSQIQAARDCQKSYADVRRKPLEFQVGDKILAKVGAVAYLLELPEQLSQVHSTFHVSNLKKCLSDDTLAIPLDEIQIADNLYFVEEPVKIMVYEVKRLKQSLSAVGTKVNAAGMRVTTAKRLQLLEEFLLLEG
ncbi:reverse transcriptase domain-containing protein [Tanacetum coccineum]